MKPPLVLPLIVLLLFGSGCASSLGPVSLSQPTPAGSTALVFGSPTTTPAEWKHILSPEAYDVVWNKGTEAPFSSPLDHETRPGTYVSADCGVPLFRSEQKYDSGTGWPSFWAPINPDVVKLVEDDSIPFEPRTEVVDTVRRAPRSRV